MCAIKNLPPLFTTIRGGISDNHLLEANSYDNKIQNIISSDEAI